MTVETLADRWEFTASGATGSFAATTPALDPTAFELRARNTSTNEIYTPTYSIAVSADGSGVTATVTAGLTSGHEVVLYRVPYGKQPSALSPHGPWPAKTNERQHDRGALDTQALWLMLKRAIRLPRVDDDDVIELPAKALRLGKYLSFDATTGQPQATAALSVGTLSVSAYIETLLNDADSATARTTLGMADAAGFTVKGKAVGASSGAPDNLTAQQLANGLLAGAAMPRAYISGFTYANGSDATNDIDIAAGACADSTNAIFASGAAMTKQLDVAWVAGTNQGGRLGGAIADGDYNIWALIHGTTFAVDYGMELVSATTPTLPSGYSYYRKIGWFKRAAGSIVAFKTHELAGGGLHFKWVTGRLDVALSNTLTTARRTDTLSLPLNLTVMAHIIALTTDAGSAHNAWVGCTEETDGAPSATAVPLLTHSAATGAVAVASLIVKTTAGQIAARSTLATVDTFNVQTNGFDWSRR